MIAITEKKEIIRSDPKSWHASVGEKYISWPTMKAEINRKSRKVL
jgi:hypothetical protein